MNSACIPIVSENNQVATLRVGGLTPMTTIDFPDALSAVIFTQGCSLRCQYCQNTHLIPTRSNEPLSWHNVEHFLRQRRGLLDAVVFSGGEPTLQNALSPAIRSVRTLGFQTGMHTAGTSPSRFAQVLAHLDWVGFDIKALPEDYRETTGVDSGDACWRSLQILLDSGVNHEVRTTVHWQLLPPEKLIALAEQLYQTGVRRFVLQNCRTQHCFNSEINPSWLDEQQKQAVYRELNALFPEFSTR